MLTRWTLLASCSPAQLERLERAAARLALAAASCQRRRGDLHGAARAAAAVPADRLDRHHAAWLAEERALLAAELADPSSLALCPPAEQRAELVARLSRAARNVAAALDLDPGRPVARLLRGALALAGGDDRRAAADLAAAASGDALPEPYRLGPVAFARGLALLRLLEPGTEEAGTDLVLAALATGYAPPPGALVEVVEALAAHRAHRTGEVAAIALDLAPGEAGLLAAARSLARDGDPVALAAVAKAASDERRPLRERFELHADALAGAGLGPEPAAVGEHVDGLERVVHKLADPDLERRWARLLADDDAVRTALGPVHADVARVDVLRRIGALDEAAAVARGLFHRAVSGQAPELDPAELVDLLAALGETGDDELAALRRLAAPASHDDRAAASEGPADLPREVRVLFVGGNETQVRYHDDLDAAIAHRFGGRVAVEWFATGWTSNWAADAERIERRYAEADVVVLMSFMRTMLGRRLRRTAGEAGLPWVACTGHGRAALEGAVARAVALAAAADHPDDRGSGSGSDGNGKGNGHANGTSTAARPRRPGARAHGQGEGEGEGDGDGGGDSVCTRS